MTISSNSFTNNVSKGTIAAAEDVNLGMAMVIFIEIVREVLKVS